MKRRFSQIWESIAQDLKEAITKGDLKPGQRLKIDEITSRYGVSNTPVREAFRYLASQGFLENVPRKKVIVKEMKLKEINDIYAIHSVLEGLAAKMAAKSLNEKGFKKLNSIYRAMEKYLRDGNITKYIQADKEFHITFIRCSENEILVPMAENLSSRIERCRFLTLQFPGRAEASLNEHREILMAFQKNDAITAEKEVKRHILISSKCLREVLRKTDEYISS